MGKPKLKAIASSGDTCSCCEKRELISINRAVVCFVCDGVDAWPSYECGVQVEE